jgi:Spy/CpxP family protein refolding chaperone
MKRWIKRTLIGAFGATLLIGGLSACGHSHHGGWQMSDADATKMREKMLDRAGRELKLDDAQKQRLATLADTIKAQRTALMGTVTEPRADPRAEAQAVIAGAKFDRARAQAFVESKTTAVRTQSPEVIAAAADFYDSLNPAQQQQVRDFMSRRSRWGHHG